MTALHIGALIILVIGIAYFVDWAVDKLTLVYQNWRYPVQWLDYVSLDDVEV